MVACDNCGEVEKIGQIANVYDGYEYYCSDCSETGTKEERNVE